jgi:NAD+ kinase
MDYKNNTAWEDDHDNSIPADLSDPDLIVALGGDGTIMYAAHVFSGPVPPILPVAGGSMGFLTPFAREEILDAILISLGMQPLIPADFEHDDNTNGLRLSQRANNNMLVEDISRESYEEKPTLAFGRNDHICLSMRMRLDCRIFTSDGKLKSRYNVLNEVVIDRGSSPYLVR